MISKEQKQEAICDNQQQVYPSSLSSQRIIILQSNITIAIAIAMPTSKSLLLSHTIALFILKIAYNGAKNFSNITDALAFYGVYHRDPINQIIHFFGVPCIIWSLLVFFSHLNLPGPLFNRSSFFVNIPFVPTHKINYGTVLSFGYIVFYIKLDKFGGILYAPFAYLMYVTAVSTQIKDQVKAREQIHKKKHDDINTSASASTINFTKTPWTGTGRALKLAGVIHFLGWYVQIHPGHGIYEGAKPAVMQSVGGALTSAPLFAYYEGLWFLGLNKELQEETKLLVDVYTKKLCDEGVAMRACDGVSDYN